MIIHFEPVAPENGRAPLTVRPEQEYFFCDACKSLRLSNVSK